jgi:hypothetical protein
VTRGLDAICQTISPNQILDQGQWHKFSLKYKYHAHLLGLRLSFFKKIKIKIKIMDDSIILNLLMYIGKKKQTKLIDNTV